MKRITDRTSNPFGMRPPCKAFDDDNHAGEPAVFGYGDPNADFHVIGDHPGVHGGYRSGIPFTDADGTDALQSVFRTVGFASGEATAPALRNCFASYLHLCCVPNGQTPPPESYAELEAFFDAELRAINAHVLLPVGQRASDHVLTEYTTQRGHLELDMARLHASEIRGRGFLVLPIRDPTAWRDTDHDALVSTLQGLLESDYRQTKGVATTVG